MPKVQNTQPTRERGAGRPANSGSSAAPQLPTSLTACKKQVRNVTRLLTRQTLNSATRTDLERRLKALTILQSQMSSAQTDKTNASRYHSIKFFERKKVIRKLTQLEKKIEKDGKEGLEDELTELFVSLNYTTYYPDEYKYISLFPADPTKTTSETKERQAFIQKRIARAMENGKLPRDPRAVNAEDRKAIRKGNKLLLRSVSQAHGKPGADQSGSESGDSAAEGDDADEFFE